jgi:hypothetical protein
VSTSLFLAYERRKLQNTSLFISFLCSRLHNSTLKLLLSPCISLTPTKITKNGFKKKKKKNTRCAPYPCLIAKLWLIGEIENNLFAQWALGGSELELVPW